MIIIDNITQGSDEWQRLRIGNPGASSMHKIITATGKPSASAGAYLDQLFDEIILNRKLESYQNWRMEEGIKKEGDSRKDYEFRSGYQVKQVAMCFKDEKRLFHCSPDGLIPEIKRGFETKDALPHVHDERLENPDSFLKQHFVQIQMCLYVTGYNDWVLKSYCENMPPLELLVKPDNEFLKKLEAELYKFIGKLHQKINKYKGVK